MVDYEQAYGGEAAYFGEGANPFLTDHCQHIQLGGTVLDVGIGQGRNALALARRGYRVTGIDTSTAAIEATGQRAAAAGFEVGLHEVSFLDWVAPDGPYDAVLVFGLLQELERELHVQLFDQVSAWTGPGSILYLTAWHVDDPRVEELRRTSAPLGRLSFRTPRGQVRTYLERGEIVDLLSPRGWQMVHHWEGLGEWHQHGDAEPERHGVIEVVAERRGG